jgi:hypothetical protein
MEIRNCRIELAGRTGATAMLERIIDPPDIEPSGLYIRVVINNGGTIHTHHILTDDYGDMLSMASCITEQLDGSVGFVYNSDNAYFDVLYTFAAINKI